MTKKAYSLQTQEQVQRRTSDLNTNAIELTLQDFQEAKPTTTKGRGLNEGSANVTVTGPAPHDPNGQAGSVQMGMKTTEDVVAESARGDLPSAKIALPASRPDKSENSGTSAGRDAGSAMGEGEEEEGPRGCCGRKRKEKQPTVGMFELFRYAGPLEIVMMLVGTLGAIAAGCSQPVVIFIMGRMTDVFFANVELVNNSNQTYGERIKAEMQPLVVYCVLVGVAALVSGYMALSLWNWAGERQITNIRKQFFRGVLRQDIGWFDTHEVSELNSRFSDDMQKIGEGLREKVPIFIQWCSTWLCAYVIAFVSGWKLTFAVVAFSPLFFAVASTVSWLLRNMSEKELKAYAKAGAVAEQALRAIRTVQAFQGQEKEQKKYEDNLTFAKRVGILKVLVLGVGFGLLWLIVFIAVAAAFYFGVTLIQKEGLRPGNVQMIFFVVLVGSLSLGYAFPCLETFSNARAAAVKVFEIIDLHPEIDITSPAGKTPETLRGVIEFKDVYFRYPARPEVQVLKGLNLTIGRGQTVALVGASGCGKSTIVQLLQRFYDPESGQVTVDGHDIKDLNLKWLRDQIGVVSQEPVLFAATIADNIGYGHLGATQDRIKAAAIEANAHDFIVNLPQGYDTLVGERGAQLSGGQKQRVAIARALVKNPRILLLDEATSALDHESEAVVQQALEKAREGRTTIVIAHRLSTVRNADKIVSISQGMNQEEGVHEELMERGGLYSQLVKHQMRAAEDGVNDIVDEDGDPTDPTAAPKVALKAISASGSVATGTSLRLKGKKRKESAGQAEKDNKVKEEKEEEEEQPASFKRLLQLNSPEWLVLLAGTVMSVISGLSQPGFAFILSEFLRVFSIQDKDEQLDVAAVVSGYTVGVGVAVAILRISSGYCFGKAGAELTARIRSLTFRSVIKQDMSYFDSSENHVGTLTTRLSSDASLVQGATGIKIAPVLEAMVTIAASLVLAFFYGWKLTLVILAFLPVMVLAGKVHGKAVGGSAKSEASNVLEAGKICSEAVDNIRTIASMNSADIFIDKLDHLLDATTRSAAKMSQLLGITNGITVSIQNFTMAAAFAYGSHLVASGEMEFYNVFRVYTAIILGGSAVGRRSSFGMDYTKAKMAAGRLFAIIDKQPKIDVDQTDGKHLEDYKGGVAVHEAVFHYPTRDTVRVLDGLTMEVEPGQTLALVGGSGCGKSTVLQLLQRFYDTDSGAVMINGHDLKTLNLRWFRQQLGIVSQEPTLFDDTIAANIAYGDNSRQVPMHEVIVAARAANIHNFIDGLPQGYDTNVGDKGTQLSGGQKQRIAIARALVRQPKVLLLDEATSALDTESERIVQEALDKAREGRTCIVIAHRLTTIQTADRIAVLNDGRVEEMGTHSQLVAREGAYFRLLQAQNTVRKS